MKKLICTLYLLAGIVSTSMLAGCTTETKETGAVIENTQESDNTAATETEKESSESPKEGAQEEVSESDTSVSQVSEAEIHFIDVGNADAILIISDGKAMLVDGGENGDEALVVNYIRNQGITELEYVISTHAHADHVGGLDAVVSSFNVGKVFVANGDASTKTYRDFINAAMDKGLSPSVPLEDVKFPLGGAYFTVMNTNGGSDTNNESLVVEFVNGEDKVLLMGDAETEVEKEILSKVSQVDLLKVGHHGSRTSTSQSFLEKVNPVYGVITCGTGNSYGHPHKETVSKLEGIEVHRTDECGNIIFKSTGSGLVTDCGAGSLTPGDKKDGASDDDESEESDLQTGTNTDQSSASGRTGTSTGQSSASGSTGTSADQSSASGRTGTSTGQSSASGSIGTSTGQSSASGSTGTSAGQSSASNSTASNSSQNNSASGSTADAAGTVYWTPNGKSYHTTKSCSTLSRSKTILSGTIAESGKDDPCDRCH